MNLKIILPIMILPALYKGQIMQKA